MSELERQSTEQAVLRDPWPDAPRLAFADAVAATDPERAQAIRGEIALLRARRAGVRYRLPEDDALPVWKSHTRARIEPTLADLFPPGNKAHRYGLGRGFVEQVWASAPWLLDHAPTLFSRAPVLDLYVSGLAGHLEAFFHSPWLARIRSLGLSQNKLDDHAVERIAASPFLGRLRGLDLSFNRVGAAGLDALATTPNLPQLRYVGFRQNLTPDPNYVIESCETYETPPVPTEATDAFLARHPGCRFIGRFGEPPNPGLLQAEDGGPIG